jgi:hypothetical protein
LRLSLGPLTLLTAGLAACKPPPTDSDVARAATTVSLRGPSAPIASPDTMGALWTPSQTQPGRLVYGLPGEPVILAIECVRTSADAPANIRISRHAPADSDATALLALIGNGAIGRLEVEATRQGQRQIWLGEIPATNPGWEPLAGPREITATVPGAGLVRLNPSPLPMQFLQECRNPLPVPSEMAPVPVG